MITLTDAAAEQVRRAAEQSGAEDLALRVAAREGADGIDYGIGFDEQREQDEAFDCNGVTVLVSPRSREATDGLVVDYVEIEPGDFRFIFYRAGEHPSGSPSGGEDPAGGGCGQGGCGRH